MKYFKALGLTKKNTSGYYDPERNLIVVDFGEGMLRAVLTSYHEVAHKLSDLLHIYDWVDAFAPFLSLSYYQKPERLLQPIKTLFFTEPQDLTELIPNGKSRIIVEGQDAFMEHLDQGWTVIDAFEGNRYLMKKQSDDRSMVRGD